MIAQRTLGAAIAGARARLCAGIEAAGLEARLLAAHVFGLRCRNADRPSGTADRRRRLLSSRPRCDGGIGREPLAYIWAAGNSGACRCA